MSACQIEPMSDSMCQPWAWRNVSTCIGPSMPPQTTHAKPPASASPSHHASARASRRTINTGASTMGHTFANNEIARKPAPCSLALRFTAAMPRVASVTESMSVRVNT